MPEVSPASIHHREAKWGRLRHNERCTGSAQHARELLKKAEPVTPTGPLQGQERPRASAQKDARGHSHRSLRSSLGKPRRKSRTKADLRAESNKLAIYCNLATGNFPSRPGQAESAQAHSQKCRTERGETSTGRAGSHNSAQEPNGLPPQPTLNENGEVHLRKVAHHRHHFKACQAECDQCKAQAGLKKQQIKKTKTMRNIRWTSPC